MVHRFVTFMNHIKVNAKYGQILKLSFTVIMQIFVTKIRDRGFRGC